MTASGERGKARKKETKDKATQKNPAPHQPPNHIPLCALCDVFGHATHTSRELPRIKPMVKVVFLESSVHEAPASSSTPNKNPKTIHTNQPCALCDLHGHYSHHCPHLMHYYTSLEVVQEYEVENNQSTSPILA